MSIGTGIVLFVVGAILAFAVNVQLDWINLDLIGYLLMGAGAVVFVIGLILAVRKRKSVTTVRTAHDPNSGEQVREKKSSESGDTVL